MTSPGITLQRIGLSYGDKALFSDLSAHFQGARWHSILGRSGVGKSSLIQSIAGLLAKSALTGQVVADDHLPLAGRIAWMGQRDCLLPWLTVLDNVLLGLHLRKQDTRSAGERAQDLLQSVGLADLAKRMPAQLSGGQRQRVALARTLMEDKPVVLMDEPFSALDAITKLQLQDLAATLLHDRTVLLITHDPLEALRLSDEVWLMTGRSVRMNRMFSIEEMPPPRALDDARILSWQGELLAHLQRDLEVPEHD
ncbi:Aliphatic sulfonates import ATP-binding protein SsuB [Oligella sp. MSHR50489EDL]|uniref:ABC transporter ATP-binding protein n=1 Tax=Oligella sp. MSHR50489EDL TaxID=3139409 RepID=UPI003D81BA43